VGTVNGTPHQIIPPTSPSARQESYINEHKSLLLVLLPLSPSKYFVIPLNALPHSQRRQHAIKQLAQFCGNTLWDNGLLPSEIVRSPIYAPRVLEKMQSYKIKIVPFQVPVPETQPLRSPLSLPLFKPYLTNVLFLHLQGYEEYCIYTAKVLRMGMYYTSAIRNIEINQLRFSNLAWYNPERPDSPSAYSDFHSIYMNLYYVFRTLSVYQECNCIHFQHYYDYLHKRCNEPKESPKKLRSLFDSDNDESGLSLFAPSEEEEEETYDQLMLQKRQIDIKLKLLTRAKQEKKLKSL